MPRQNYLHTGKIGPEGNVLASAEQSINGDRVERTGNRDAEQAGQGLLEFSTSEDEPDFDDLPKRRLSHGCDVNMPNWVRTARKWTVVDRDMMANQSLWKVKQQVDGWPTVVRAIAHDSVLFGSVGYRVDTVLESSLSKLWDLLVDNFADRAHLWNNLFESGSVAVRLHEDTQILNLSFGSNGWPTERRDCVCVKCVKNLNNGGFIVSYRCIEHPPLDPAATTSEISHCEISYLVEPLLPESNSVLEQMGEPGAAGLVDGSSALPNTVRFSYFRRVRQKKCVARVLDNLKSPRNMLREIHAIRQLTSIPYEIPGVEITEISVV